MSSFLVKSLFLFLCLTNMSIIQVECLAAGALQLLLRLKRHLKILYDLNDARCQVWLSELAVSCA